ncbi:GAF domain-containing protein [Rhizobium leguminosarum]|uniref:GAF domain-containing protein n=1 Tax=Rhizobium leguminosarum TaxID=384 RepID=UPI001C94BC53|nr:GAF domain-containing protein [Rhizobium leguminosarum]MBY5406700.1 GAF domain-containing protein [Rhizobium leguminosarum]
MTDPRTIQDIAFRISRSESDAAALDAIESACADRFDHILFTALRFDYSAGVMTRLFSSRQDVSPAGGTKPIPSGPWADRLITQGRCYIGYSKEDLKEVFFDHETLWAIGCESVMNVPVVWRGNTVGTFNILSGPAQYDEEDAAEMMILAQLAAPIFIARP